MQVRQYLADKRVNSIILATIAIQTFVILTGIYLKFNEGSYSIESTTSLYDEQVSLLESKDNDESLELVSEEVPQKIKKVSYKIKSGDTLSKIWTKYTGQSLSSVDAAKALKKIGVRDLKVGQKIKLEIENQNVTNLTTELADGELVTLVGELDQENKLVYKSTITKPLIIEEERTISGIIDSSFSRAAIKNNVPYQIVDQIVDLFGARIEFRKSVQPGDAFSVIYTERKLANGKILEPGPIKGASFENNGKWLAAVSHINDQGKRLFFDDQGNALGNYFLRYPVQFSRISSQFTTARFHPVLKRNRPHNGVDFAAPTGTPVRSVADGVVVDAGYRGSAGKMVKIDHGDKYATAYLHLHSIPKNLRKGSRVSRGEVIGTVGSTGLSTGPHLHYSFYINGRYVDPLKVDLPQMASNNSKIPQEKLDQIILALKTSQENMQVALNRKRTGDA
jgi:murein DD-endopeptidase MepM/ murein hydrolase activator NlpD